MLRSEILLEGHHIWLKSAYNVKHNLSLHIDPFYDLHQEAYEVLYCIDTETALRWVMERDKQIWRNKETEPLHRLSPPKYFDVY